MHPTIVADAVSPTPTLPRTSYSKNGNRTVSTT